jgi:hypothetical protein
LDGGRTRWRSLHAGEEAHAGAYRRTGHENGEETRGGHGETKRKERATDSLAAPRILGR